MFFGPPLSGLPLFRPGQGRPLSAAGWMASRGAGMPGDWRWLRAQAYRGGSRDPRGAATWRAQFDDLARRSLQKFQQTVPGANKLANPAAVHGVLRDLQNARVSLNDMQVRAKAAELRVITDYLRRPDVSSVRVIPSSGAGRTPDLYVTYRNRPPERVEVRTLTGSAVGWRRSPAVPGTRAFDAGRLARAIDAKIRRGQLTAAVPGLSRGGTIAVRMEAPPAQALAMARDAMRALSARLVGASQVQRVEIHTGGQLLSFERQGNGRYRESVSARLPRGGGRRPARARAAARRPMTRPRRARR